MVLDLFGRFGSVALALCFFDRLAMASLLNVSNSQALGTARGKPWFCTHGGMGDLVRLVPMLLFFVCDLLVN
jgi:hypothetical protein